MSTRQIRMRAKKRIGWTVLVGALSIPYAGNALTLNVDVSKSGGEHYTGTAAAPDSGTTWNSFTSLSTISSGSVKDSNGDTADGVAITFSSADGSLSIWNDAGSGSPNPQNLMSDYTYKRTYTFDVTGLTAGQQFALYAYLHGNVDNQTGAATLDSDNGGASASITQSGDYSGFRDIEVWGEGYNWVKLLGAVDATGAVSFDISTYVNGFQLQLLAPPVISGLADRTVVAGTSEELAPTISGSEALSYQWFADQIALVGETNATLSLDNVQCAQDGTLYSLVASNDAGAATNSMTLSVIVTPEIFQSEQSVRGTRQLGHHGTVGFRRTDSVAAVVV